MRLAWRNLIQERTRLALSVAGVALAILLILLLQGFLRGMFRQIAGYLENSPGSLVVAQDGVVNLLGATSLLPPDAEAEARQVKGIETVVPILSQFVILDLHDKKQPAYLIGYEPAIGGGPWQMVYPVDGLADAPDERYEIPLPAGADAARVVIRATDLLQNVTTQPAAGA